MTALLATAISVSGVLAPGELILRDGFLRVRPSHPAAFVASVLVDEESIRREGAWPWKRERLAELVDRIRESGAAGVVLDLLLPEPREGDALLAASLARIPSLLAVGFDDRGRFLLPAPALLGNAQPAHVSFQLDQDGVVRRFLATRHVDGRSLPALPIAAARLADAARAIPVGQALRPGFRLHPEGVPTVSAAEVLAGSVASKRFAGLVVFVGASAAGIGDRVMSPVSRRGAPDPGVLVQAAATESILTGDLLRPTSPVLAGLLAGLVSFGMGLARRGPGSGGFAGALAVAFLPLPLSFASSLLGRLELPGLAMTIACLVVGGVFEAGSALRLRQESSTARRRVAELEAIAAGFEEDRREEAEARRVVAHELKTPLTSVRGLAQLLQGFDLSDPERRRVAGMVVAETSRLNQMVEALLDLERLKLQDFGRRAERVSVSRLVAERVALLRTGHGREILSEVQTGLDVSGDATLLGRVVDNLVENAMKFSPASSPVTVTLRASGSGEAVFGVADRGPGVPAEERDRIFKRFARGRTAEGVAGLGLGLALVSEVAVWHRGRVELESPPGGGSIFRVRLPLAPAAAGSA